MQIVPPPDETRACAYCGAEYTPRRKYDGKLSDMDTCSYHCAHERGLEREFGPNIPLAPIQEWIEQALLDSTTIQLADRCGVDERTIYRMRRGIQTGKEINPATRRWRAVNRLVDVWRRFPVENMLHLAGVDFYDVYPEFAHERDVRLEPDAWCEKCREVVTPMDGICLWCDEPVSKWQEPEEMAA